MKKKSHPIHIIIFLASLLMIWACTTEHRAAPKLDQKRKEKPTEVRNVSIILLKGVFGDTVTMHPGMGIFADKDLGNLRYRDVVDEVNKSLGIDIRKLDFDNIPQDKRENLFNNGIIAIYRARPPKLRKAVIFFQNSSTDQIYLVKNSKVFKTNWAGVCLLKAEFIEIEILTNQGEVLHAKFRIDYKDPKNPEKKWALFKQDRTLVRYDDPNEFKPLKNKTFSTLKRLCGSRDLSHIFPRVLCKRHSKK